MMAPLPHCGERDFCRCSRKFLDIVASPLEYGDTLSTIVFARSKRQPTIFKAAPQLTKVSIGQSNQSQT